VPVNDLAGGYDYPAEVRFEIAEQNLRDEGEAYRLSLCLSFLKKGFDNSRTTR